MKTKTLKILLLLFSGLIVLTLTIIISCKKENTSNIPFVDVVIQQENTKLQAAIPSATVSASLSGIIADESGTPLANVKVTYGSTAVNTDASGAFTFGSLSLNKLYASVKAEKAGYLDGFRTFAPTPGVVNTISIQLMTLGTPNLFNSSTGGALTLDTKIDITFTANSIVTEDGKAYNGAVSVYGRYIDPYAANFYDIMPGTLIGLTGTNQLSSLVSYGMTNVVLKDTAGNKLQLAKDKTASISIPAPDGSPDTILLWHFNEKYGLWIQSGSAIKTGGKYIGSVNHFSPWNHDVNFPPAPDCVGIDGTVSDIDGNVYRTIKIGTQCWMQENLKTTHYNDGTPIPTGLTNAAWANTDSGAYSIYDNNAANNTRYGKLYNWFAVNTGKLAPVGWHVPTDAEWNTLASNLGGVSVAGSKMKATTLWTPYTGINNMNSSGFTGLPAGYRNNNGPFSANSG